MAIDLQREISRLRTMPVFGRWMASALQLTESAVNGLAQNLAADPTQTLPAPPQLQSVNVAHNGGNIVHVTLTDNNPTQKNMRYFVEWDTNPAFPVPQVEDLGASRGRVLNLPQGTYYVRGFHQAQGGNPSPPLNYGGATPTAITVSSGSTLSLLSSTGSGTGASNGQNGGVGLGKVLFRGSPGPKRTAA